jgi:hypothetical protein
VCVLAAGIGIYVGTRSDPAPGPAVTGLDTAWTAHSPGAQCLDHTSDNTWVADGDVASCLNDGITSYQLSTGHQEWTWNPAPRAGQDSSMGTLSNAVDQGIGVVQYNYYKIPSSSTASPDYTATEVSGIDLATGRTLWTASVPVADEVEPPGLVVGDGVVAMVLSSPADDTVGERDQLTGQTLSVLDLSTGAAAWPEAARSATVPEACHPISIAISGSWLYDAARCPQAQGADRLYGLSPRTGAIQAAVPLEDQVCISGGGPGNTTLWAVPGYLVGGCDYSDTQQAMLIVPTGTVNQRVLRYTSDLDPLDYFSTETSNPGFAAHGSTLYALTLPIAGDADSVTAFDLAKGTILWSRDDADVPAISGYDHGSLLIEGADSRGVIVLDSGGNTQQDSGAESLVLLSADTGTATIFGPGTSYDDTPGSNDDSLEYYLTGQVLLAFPYGDNNTGLVTAYRTGARF